jgi:hypothetical protein
MISAFVEFLLRSPFHNCSVNNKQEIRKKRTILNRVAIPASRLGDCNQYMLRAFIKFLLGPPFGDSGIILFGAKAASD